MPKIVSITGTSTGLGTAIAVQSAANGDGVRRPPIRVRTSDWSRDANCRRRSTTWSCLDKQHVHTTP